MATRKNVEEEMVFTVEDLPSHTVSAKVSAVVYRSMEDYRWANRLSKSEVLVEALEAWIDANGLRDAAVAALTAELS